MKTPEEVEDRIRALLREELERRIRAASEKLPCRCVYNHRQPLDTRRSVDGEPNTHFNRISNDSGLPVIQTIGLCMYGAQDPETWGGTICEDPIDAQRCPFFTPRQGKEDIRSEFKAQIADVEWLRANLPQVEALRWALTEEKPLAVSEETPHAPLSWWELLLLRFFGLRVVRSTPSLPAKSD